VGLSLDARIGRRRCPFDHAGEPRAPTAAHTFRDKNEW
jgi:hypothetical protein